ncbi:hypothetical protein [Singulisphaera sp. PoT]|uniref:hypothetical protein n=1 Tax=Singulisphaera sp. PoT TaxID=3411797 RepID=UPI003BF5D184
MKGLIKAIVKKAWQFTRPIRRPFVRKIHAHLTQCMEAVQRPHPIVVVSDESIVLMDQVVRELVRLQRQVDTLQQSLDAMADERAHPAIAGELELMSERLRAG